MPENKIAASHFSPDTLDFLFLLNKYSVRYVIVDGEIIETDRQSTGFSLAFNICG